MSDQIPCLVETCDYTSGEVGRTWSHITHKQDTDQEGTPHLDYKESRSKDDFEAELRENGYLDDDESDDEETDGVEIEETEGANELVVDVPDDDGDVIDDFDDGMDPYGEPGEERPETTGGTLGFGFLFDKKVIVAIAVLAILVYWFYLRDDDDSGGIEASPSGGDGGAPTFDDEEDPKMKVTADV